MPTNRARATGRVASSGVLTSTSAKKNSFQAEMKENSAVATMPGASSGKTTRRSTWSRVAPSTLAASSSSRGMLRTNPWSIHSANGSAQTT